MLEQQPSRTAFAAAAYRAAHQVLDDARIFRDPLALSILGETPESIRNAAEAGRPRSGMRFFISARSQFAETALHAGIETRNVEQLVVLGAGLDTFAYRSPFASRLKIFEVDHPATQAWKRRRLAEAGIAIPPQLAFAPVDFEKDSLAHSLKDAGLDPAKRTFFMWLGVVPYLRIYAIGSTLTVIGEHPGGAEVVFDYSDPPETLPPEMQAAYQERAARVAAIGEPFLSYFEPEALKDMLAQLGLAVIEDLGPRGIARRFAPEVVAADPAAAAAMPNRGGHMIHAATC